MKVGDLVKVKDCPVLSADWPPNKCSCFFCSGESNRVGVILSPAPRNSWDIMFDCGMWRFDQFEFARGEISVISKSDCTIRP